MVDGASASEQALPDPLARRFEGIILVGPRAELGPDLGMALRELVDVALPAVQITSELEVPPALSYLWDRGVHPASTLVVIGADAGPDPGAVPLPAGPVVVRVGHRGGLLELDTHHRAGGTAQITALLADQRERRRCAELPASAPAPGWALTFAGFDPEQERVRGALLALADGTVGWLGVPSAGHPAAPPLVVHAGVYDGGDGIETRLLEGPVPALVLDGLDDDARLHRVLDLRAGVLHEELLTSSLTVRCVRFCARPWPGLLVRRLQLSGSAAATHTTRLLEVTGESPATWHAADDGAQLVSVTGDPGAVTAAATARADDNPDGPVHTHLVAHSVRRNGGPLGDVPPRLPDLTHETFDRLLGEHRAEWARRWEDADVVVEGDDDLQLALRFSLYHLMSCAADGDEAAVGARGLTGTGYRGHVFWDADAFTLPFLAATHPASARAMLEYRIRRLPAAMAAARALGRRGARFPWESARTGRDVTPPSARDRSGRLVPIRTGLLEDHIVADVAWAARCYVEWTGDEAFARNEGLPLFIETARYWASRVRLDAEGQAHIYGVIGPDEYHEPVDDNAYTNVMARWNLRAAAALTAPEDPLAAGTGVGLEERARWLELADALLDGYDPDSGVYEQFAGFHRLEPLIIEEVAPRRPIAADLLLGADRVRAAQVLKQADVLMLHHLVPDQVVPGTLEPNLRFYGPRTAHGSSLSPAIHASLYARARDYERAMGALEIASRIDLDDLTGSTAGGLHIATMGGLWQAMVWGFAGIRPLDGRLTIDPLLPRAWTALEVHVRYRGSRVTVRREGLELHVHAESAVPVRVDGQPYDLDASGLSFTRRRHAWELNR